jgi:hypothetical protein
LLVQGAKGPKGPKVVLAALKATPTAPHNSEQSISWVLFTEYVLLTYQYQSLLYVLSVRMGYYVGVQ